MARKILTGILIGLSSILLIFSGAGIGAAWVYNGPVTQEAVTRLQGINAELSQIQSDLKTARAEVERALRIIDSVEQGLQSLTEQAQDASQLLEELNGTLDDQLIPSLGTTRSRITQLRGTLAELRNALAQVNSLPFLNLNIPGDEVLASIIGGVDSLNTDLADIEDLAHKASTFLDDTTYLLGGDFNETKQNLKILLQSLKDYEAKVTGWRDEVSRLIESAPRWIDNASIIITLFLLWFGFSQFGLLLHGLNLRQGGDPLVVLRKKAP